MTTTYTQFFERKTRDSGEAFYALTDDAPTVAEHAAHPLEVGAAHFQPPTLALMDRRLRAQLLAEDAFRMRKEVQG